MGLESLTQLYTPLGLLADGDGDGLPDGLNVRFVVGRTPGAVDVAARLGLETCALTPGFTRPDAPGVPLYFGPDNPHLPPVAVPPGCGVVALTPRGVVVTGDTFAEGWAAARWLAVTFPLLAPGGPTLAEQAGGRAVRKVVLRQGQVVDLELGDPLEAGGPEDKPTLQGAPPEPPFRAEAPGDLPPDGPARLFTVAGLMGSSDGVCHDRTAWQVQVGPETTPEEIAALCELAARTGVESTGLRFPVAVAQEPEGLAVRLASAPPERCLWQEEHLAWTDHGLVAFGTPGQRAAALRRAAEGGLVDGIHATLFTRRAALPEQTASRGPLLLDLSFVLRWEVDRFREAWRSVLPRLRPGVPVQVDVRLSEPREIRQALEEEIRRDLAEAGVPVADLHVRSAYKQGFGWLEEEVLPRLKALGTVCRVELTCRPFMDVRNPEEPGGGTLELPIRWLQEVYPADELLSRELGGIPVAFALAEGPQEYTYRLTAWDGKGRVVFTAHFDPVFTERLYLPDEPRRGWVHPPTGLLRVRQEDDTVADGRLETDLEAFWTLYQEEVLPRLRQQILDRYGSRPGPDAQPFFGALVVEVAVSEEDRWLGIRQEQVSPADALHEDIYFYTLDFLNELGIARTGRGYPAPGAVEPWITVAAGEPRVRVRLYGLPPFRQEEGGLPRSAAVLPDPAPGIPVDRIIGPDQLPPCLAYLARLPGVRVWRTGLSYGGRATWALSVTAPTAGSIAPPQKLSAWRPTLLVNARHHANEVSSTNSILLLAERAAREGLHRRINLVLSPMENVDGAALHYRMQEVHPYWKLHAARFNAAGIDFASECFAPVPRFGEARTLPTLWRNFLPDVVLDDHGYPSQEWAQPFAGYNSPPYFRTSWWIPSALIYGIHHWLAPERFPANGAVQNGIRDALAARLTADPELSAYSAQLLERFVTYAHRYVPEKFPLQIYRGFVSLISPVAAGPDARTYSGRFPHITAAQLVTEVPDETAQGSYLARCVKAHLEGDLAVGHYLAASPQPVVRRSWQEGGGVWWSVGRQRPFRPNNTAAETPPGRP